jgi:tight adherence protein C
MTIAIIAFLAIFILVGSAGFLLFFRAGMMARLAGAVAPESEEKISRWLRVKDAGQSLKAVVQPLEKMVPKSSKEVSVVEKRLISAGYRSEGVVRIFYGAKVLVPLLLCVVVAGTGLGYKFGFFGYALALGLGFLGPDFWLGRQIKKRNEAIRLGLPETLDLMVVCIEAGLSLDQSLNRSVKELSRSQPEICDELGLVLLEQRAGRPRVDSWRNLSDRVDVDSIRALVSSIIQAEQFGTSISKILRIHSDTLRTQRRQRVEEEAAKTAVKLVFPLVFFIFPSLFVVTLGPAIITIGESFKKYFQ